MRLNRAGATIAASLLTGAAVLGFGLGTAQADPVDWTAAADTTVTLDLGDGPASDSLPPGTFEGEVDDDASTITGEVEHPVYSIEIDTGLVGMADLDLQLSIRDIDLDWNQDDDTVAGTVLLDLELLEVGVGSGIELSPCNATAFTEVTGTYVDDVLTFGGDIGEIALDGECGGTAFRGPVEDAIGGLSGDFETVVGGEAPVDEPEPEETTTTTEAPAEDPPAGGGATPIAKAPAYTG